jgi:hypothetical protein
MRSGSGGWRPRTSDPEGGAPACARAGTPGFLPPRPPTSRSPRRGTRRWVFALAALVAGAWATQQALGKDDRAAERPGEFDMMRVQYDSVGGANQAYYFAYGREWQRWETDFPEAEKNFAVRLGQLTRIRPGSLGDSVRLTDANLFEHPFLYMSDVGWMELSAREQTQLREYLTRGGFLWVDDFWGDAEWDNFAGEMRGVLPDSAWREIPLDHPVMHTVFDIAEAPMVPARDFADDEYGREPAGLHRSPAGSMEPAHLRGYFAPDGRLMVVATHNTDLGDGFEREAYGQFFFEHYSTRAYAMGVNIVVYALTH